MTWTKLGAEFSDECAENNLTDAAFRTHVEAIQYLYGIESAEMRIQKHLMRRWAGSTDYQAGAAFLVGIEWWADDGETFVVLHHGGIVRQSLVAQQAKRDRDRDHKRTTRKGVSAHVASDSDSDGANDGATAQTDRQTDKPVQEDDSRNDEETPEEVRAALMADGTWDLSSSRPPESELVDLAAAPVRNLTPAPAAECPKCGVSALNPDGTCGWCA